MIRRALHSLLGSLKTLEERVALLNPTAWYDASETYAKSKIAVGISGGVKYLEGSADIVNVSQPFSISFWIDPSSVASTAHIISTLTGGGSGFLIRLNNNKIQFYLYGTGILWLESDTTVSASGYQHFVVTSDGSFLTNKASALTGYINGVSTTFTATSDSITVLPSTIGNFTVANSEGGSGNQATADYDQVKVFNKALTSTEVSELYNSNSGLNYKDLTGSETFYGNIVAWYDFNIPTNFGRNYAEASHAVDFDSVAKTSFFSFAHTAIGPLSVAFNQPYSVACWIKLDTVNSFSKIYEKKDSGGIIFSDLLFSNGTTLRQIMRTTSSTDELRNTYTLDFDVTGQWVHIALTYDGSLTNAGAKLYLNGVEQAYSATISTLTTSSSPNGNLELFFFADKTVDEIAIYHDELTAGEVSTLYNGGIVAEASTLHTDNLVSSWSFDEQSPNLIGQDKYGTNDLTPVSIVEADLVGGVKDARTQYIETNGSSQYLEDTNAIPNTLMTGGAGWSMSFWIEPDTIASVPCIFAAGNSTPDYDRILVAIDSGGLVTSGAMAVGIASGGTHVWGVTNSSVISTNTLVHVAVTIPHEGQLSIYINGAAAETLSGTYTGDFSSLDFDVFSQGEAHYMFANNTSGGGAGNLFDGTCYNLQIWNTVLTRNGSTGEIDELYSLGKDGVYSDYTGSTTNLVAWYDFENSADLGKDSFSTNDLTVNGSPTVGPHRETSLDLTEVSIDSTNAVLGHIEGKSAGFDGVTKWTDRSTNGNDAIQNTLTNVPTWIENTLNATEDVVRFDGTDDHIEYVDGLGSIATGSFSITILFYLNGRGVAGDNGLFGTQSGNNFVRLYWSNAIGDTPIFYYQANSQGNRFAYPNTTITAGNYYHITCVAEANSATGIKMYINGSEITYNGGSSRSLTGGYDMSQYTNAVPFEWGNVGGLSLYSNINMLQGKIFNKALSPTEVSLINNYYNDKYGLSL